METHFLVPGSQPLGRRGNPDAAAHPLESLRDEQSPHWTAFKSSPNTLSYTTGPTELRDVDGNVIPTDPNAYNVDSARR